MSRDFLGDPMVNNLPCDAGDVGLIPGQGTKIPHAMKQLSPFITTKETVCRNQDLTQPNKYFFKRKRMSTSNLTIKITLHVL